jgi:hypothetical protein
MCLTASLDFSCYFTSKPHSKHCYARFARLLSTTTQAIGLYSFAFTARQASVLHCMTTLKFSQDKCVVRCYGGMQSTGQLAIAGQSGKLASAFKLNLMLSCLPLTVTLAMLRKASCRQKHQRALANEHAVADAMLLASSAAVKIVPAGVAGASTWNAMMAFDLRQEEKGSEVYQSVLGACSTCCCMRQPVRLTTRSTRRN